MTQNRDKFIFRVTGVKNNVTEGFIGGKASGLTLNVTFDNKGYVSTFEIENGGSNYKKGQSVS